MNVTHPSYSNQKSIDSMSSSEEIALDAFLGASSKVEKSSITSGPTYLSLIMSKFNTLSVVDDVTLKEWETEFAKNIIPDLDVINDSVQLFIESESPEVQEIDASRPSASMINSPFALLVDNFCEVEDNDSSSYVPSFLSSLAPTVTPSFGSHTDPHDSDPDELEVLNAFVTVEPIEDSSVADINPHIFNILSSPCCEIPMVRSEADMLLSCLLRQSYDDEIDQEIIINEIE